MLRFALNSLESVVIRRSIYLLSHRTCKTLTRTPPQGMVGAGVVPKGGQEHSRDVLGPLSTTLILTSESQLALSDRVVPLRTAPGSTIPRGSTLTRFFSGS